MGFKKEVATTGVIETAQEEAKPANPAKYESHRSPDEAKVRGQVRMHAIIAGYKVASSLAPTLANTAASIKDELHKLAVEVAEKIEAYSFSAGE